ncbi:hypothetical protein ACFQV2_20915 [Actinokineospora soli]|uniref:Uncharacterized protein n=1 Tax=Actinokineospora soli TaxID=1048753 RepID=A0ABW2TP66_9PSEU
MAEPAFALEPPAMAALRDQLSSCLAELRTAKGAVNQFVRVCVQRGLPVDRSLTASLHTAAQQAEHRVERELRVAAVSDLSGMLSAGSPWCGSRSPPPRTSAAPWSGARSPTTSRARCSSSTPARSTARW